MATNKEKALVLELVELVMEIGEQGKYDADIDVRAYSVDFRIAPKPFDGDWQFYGTGPAYFQSGPWTEKDFAERIGVFIHEAKKHHADYDEDGIKV